MKMMAGSCLLTSMTLEQLENLEKSLAVLTKDGWAFPEALVHLRTAITGEDQEVIDA